MIELANKKRLEELKVESDDEDLNLTKKLKRKKKASFKKMKKSPVKGESRK